MLLALQGKPGTQSGLIKPMRWELTRTVKHALFDQPKTTSYINRIANYIPHHSKCLKNLQKQTLLEDDENDDKSIPTSYTSKISSDKKSNSNIQVQISTLKSSELLSLEGKGFRVATGTIPTPQ